MSERQWWERSEEQLAEQQLVVESELDVVARCCAARHAGLRRLEVTTIASQEALDAIAESVCAVIPEPERQEP